MEETSGNKLIINKSITKNYINIKLTFIDKNLVYKNLVLPKDRTLNDIFKDFLRSHEFMKTRNKEYYFYLKEENGNKLLPKNEVVSKIGLKNGDKIFISYKILHNKIESENYPQITTENKPINTIKFSSDLKNKPILEEKKQIFDLKNKKNKIILFFILFILILLLGILLYIFLKGGSNNGNDYIT